MNDKWKTAAIVFIVLTVVLGISLIASIYTTSLNDQQWSYEYDRLHIEWCETFNDLEGIYNTQLDWLKDYDIATWNEIEYMEKLDCYLK